MPDPGAETGTTPLNTYEAKRRLREAMLRLGVDFADTLSLVRYDPTLETACWYHDERTGLEYIAIGPDILALDIPLVELVLRHELLHRAVYHTMHQRFRQPQLANIVLDICINRLLFDAFPRDMMAMSRAVYPESAKTTLIALADCSADPAQLPESDWAAIWRQVWQPGPNGTAVNPVALYFRLATAIGAMDEEAAASALTEAEATNPWSDPTSGDAAADRRIGDATARATDALRRALPRGSATGRHLSEYTVVPIAIGTDPIEDFLNRLTVHRRISEVATSITEPWRATVAVEPYPLFPSRLGFIYQALGYGDIMHRYWNRHPAPGGARMSIGFYLDVSGSMSDRYGIVAALARELADYALTLRLFDVEVREAKIEDLIDGRIASGGGTDFDPPLVDLCTDPELRAGVIFTDGYADVSEKVARDFKKCRKELYVVYLPGAQDASPKSPLDALAREVFEFRLTAQQLRILKKGKFYAA